MPNKPYHEDGNIQYYTKEARKGRRQMKKDPIVKESINNFIKDNFTATGPSANRVIQKEEYISKFTRIAESLYNGSGRDPEEIAKWVKDDFEADSQDKPEEEESDDDPAGSQDEDKPVKKEKAKKQPAETKAPISYDSITLPKLFDGLFELADNWTPNNSNMEYQHFFKHLEQMLKYPN